MTKRDNTVPLAEVVRLYSDEKWSAQRIADKYGLHYQTILRWLRDSGTPRRTGGVHSTASLDGRTLERLYVTEERTMTEIAREFGCSYEFVTKRMKEFGIKPRSKGHYQQQAWARRRPAKTR